MGTGTWRSFGMSPLAYGQESRVPATPLRYPDSRSVNELDIEIRDVQRVLLDELPPRLHGVPHEHREHLVGADGVLHRDLEERARVRLHRGVRELLRVHLAEP